MSLDQLKGIEITIKKDEGITQAIDRVAKEKSISGYTKADLLALAVEVSPQFKGRKQTEYKVGSRTYTAVSRVYEGDKFTIAGATKPAPAPATKPAPAPTAPAAPAAKPAPAAPNGAPAPAQPPAPRVQQQPDPAPAAPTAKPAPAPTTTPPPAPTGPRPTL